MVKRLRVRVRVRASVRVQARVRARAKVRIRVTFVEQDKGVLCGIVQDVGTFGLRIRVQG